MQKEVQQAAYEHQLAVEAGERVVVGVNAYTGEEAPLEIGQPDYRALETAQKERLADLRSSRDHAAVAATLEKVRAAATGSENLLPTLIDAVKARATLGEISDALRGVWGEYRAG